jgi:hypothetical protein
MSADELTTFLNNFTFGVAPEGLYAFYLNYANPSYRWNSAMNYWGWESSDFINQLVAVQPLGAPSGAIFYTEIVEMNSWRWFKRWFKEQLKNALRRIRRTIVSLRS